MTKETIQKCIDLLNTDGINSKEQVKKILQGELETIENANPSEALECLENLCDEFPILKKDYKIIKQALLKAQEQEKELEEYRLIKRALGHYIYDENGKKWYIEHYYSEHNLKQFQPLHPF